MLIDHVAILCLATIVVKGKSRVHCFTINILSSSDQDDKSIDVRIYLFFNYGENIRSFTRMYQITLRIVMSVLLIAVSLK